jgi:TolB-like protein
MLQGTRTLTYNKENMMKKYLCMMLCICIVNILMGGEKSHAYNNEIMKLSAMMAERISCSGIQTVAVADFTDLQGNVTELGRFLAEHISVALAGSGRSIMVVDRTHIRTLLKEHKLSSTGLIDPSTAKQLGKIAGVEALITGTITPFGDTVDMTIKVLHTETAKIIDANTVSLAKTNTFEELLERGVMLGQESRLHPISSTTSQASIEVKGFTFTSQGCQRTGGNVTCRFVITSNGQDRELTLYRKASRMIDEFGNEYRAVRVTLGSEATEGYSVDNVLVAGVPTKASLHFENVASEVTRAALIELSEYKYTAQLRNITIPR